VTADVSDPAQIPAVVEALGGRPLDVLVNNAGAYMPGSDSTLDQVAQQWRDNFDSNVLTAVLMTTALLPSLRRPGGRIILTSSIAAQKGGGGPYSAAKAALHGYVLDLANGLGEAGITANVIAPGYVVDSEFFTGRSTPEGHQSRVDATLVKHPGEPLAARKLRR
jgi:3-oxoacyl-[acyl-carrier protein] reductase